MFANWIKGKKVFQAKEPEKENMTHIAKCGISRHLWMYINMFIRNRHRLDPERTQICLLYFTILSLGFI